MQYPQANRKVIENAKQILALDPIFLDTETTGTGPNDVVIEIGIVDAKGAILYDSLINPGFPIPEESSAINQISDEMVKDSPAWAEAWPEIEKIVRSRPVGIYNAEFDLRLMKQSHHKQGLIWNMNEKHWFCVMKLYAAFYGEWNSARNGFRFHKLESAGRMSGIDLPNSHHAADDAKLTAALLTFVANYR